MFSRQGIVFSWQWLVCSWLWTVGSGQCSGHWTEGSVQWTVDSRHCTVYSFQGVGMMEEEHCTSGCVDFTVCRMSCMQYRAARDDAGSDCQFWTE